MMNAMLGLSFLLGAALDMFEAFHLSNGKLKTTSCQTFFA
jgi:hypothetical protein